MAGTLVWVLALFSVGLVTTSFAVPVVKSSFMQVEPDGTRCYFRYYGIHQNNQTVYRGGWIDFYFFNLVEADRNRSGVIEKSTRYWLDSSLPQFVATSSIFERSRVVGNVLRTELVQVYNLTNGASVVITNSFFNVSTTLFFDLQQGLRNVSVTPLVSKMTIAVYGWPWINKTKNHLEMEFGLNFNIFQQEDVSNPGNAIFLIPEVIGAEENNPSPEFIIRGKLQDIQYEVLLLKFGVDGNSSEVDMTINGANALSGLRQFFDTTPPVLKFNLTMKIDSYYDYVEYDPNFLVLLDSPATTGAPDASPVSAIVAAQLDTGAIAAIVVVAFVVVVAAVVIVVAIQKKKFGMKIQVNQRFFPEATTTTSPSESFPSSSTTANAQKPQQAGRWRAFSSEDVRDTQLRNAASK